jgi:hypothetical protein
MEVRHNTKLIEQALEHVVRRASIPLMEAESRSQEADARAAADRARARSITWISISAAMAVILIGIGIAYNLTLQKEFVQEASQEQKGVGATRDAGNLPPSNKESTSTSKQPSTMTTGSEPSRGPVVTEFSKFSSRKVSVAGRSFLVTVGHHFQTESDKSWSYAWCYTSPTFLGVQYKVDLAERSSPSMSPTGLLSADKTLSTAGLTREEGFALASACPWIDRTFSIDQIIPKPDEVNPFRTESTVFRRVDGVLRVSGSISAGFTDRIPKESFTKLVIDSPGGSLVEALRAGGWIRENGKSVEVERTCFSACSLILAGGNERSVLPAAKVGVHRFSNSTPTVKDLDLAQQMSGEILAYLRRMGVEPDLFQAMVSVPAHDMRYLTRNEMEKWKLISSRSELPPLPPEIFIPSALSRFQEIDDTDIPGNDFETLTGVSYDVCISACRATQQCRAFTFNVSAKWCFLKSEAAQRLIFNGAQSGIKIQ